MLSLTLWVFFGGTVGLLFSSMAGEQRPVRNVIVGVLGAILGGFLFQWNIAPSVVNFGGLFTAFIGAAAFCVGASWFVTNWIRWRP